MNKLFKFLMFWAIPLLAVMVVSCKDDEDPTPPVLEPAITSVTPSQGAVGTAVTITGNNLEDVTRVTFGGVNAAGFDPEDNTATTITAAVPAGLTPGAQNITVTSAGGSATANFTVVDATVTPGTPVITSFNPIMGPVSTPVKITGTDLDLADSAFIGNVKITDWEVNNLATEATFTIPEGAETGTFVLYHGEDAAKVESATEFTVGEPVPQITSFNPAFGPVGQKMTIQGANLDMAVTAMIGEVPITDWNVEDDGASATFTIPAGAETAAFVLTVEGEENVVSAEEFVVTPGITSFAPMTGAAGDKVTITGTNLDLATAAMLGELAVDNWMVNADGTATFNVPAGAVTGPITLVVNEDIEVVSENEFVVTGGTAENVVFESTFSPITGPRTATTEVTVTAADETNFTGATSVRIGETEVLAENYTIAADGSSITFTIPEDAVGGKLMVEMENGTIVESNNSFAFGTNPAGENVYLTGMSNTAYGDALSDDWQIWNGWGNTTNDPASTAIEGTTSIEVNYTEAYGGFQLHPEPVITLEGDESIVLSIYGAVGAGDVMLYIKPTDLPAGEEVADANKVTLDVVEGQWSTFIVPVSDLGNPTDINELVVQNRDVATTTIYIDNVMLVQ